MRSSRIKAKLARRQPVLVTSISFSDASIFELASMMGFDGIWLDMEHHAHGLEAATRRRVHAHGPHARGRGKRHHVSAM
jgi:4-hydroxy-2-oxoheptanedioate aldolase